MSRMRMLVVLTAVTVLLVSGDATESAANDGISRQTDVPANQVVPTHDLPRQADCSLIDFEGLEDNGPVGVYAGPVTVTFGTSWLGLIDADDGGSGNFANEPSPITSAYFLDTADISISLSPPVQYLEFWYTASAISLPVTVTAYDANDNVVDSAFGNTVGTSSDGADCTGDPTGNFCLWDLITLTAASDNISYIVIEGTVANQFGIDNLQFCTETPEIGACCFDDGTCQNITREGCLSAGGHFLEGVDCADADCQTVPNEQRSWSNLKQMYR